MSSPKHCKTTAIGQNAMWSRWVLVPLLAGTQEIPQDDTGWTFQNWAWNLLSIYDES